MAAITVRSEQRCHGGVIGFYSHPSSSTGTEMRFAVYLPPGYVGAPGLAGQADQADAADRASRASKQRVFFISNLLQASFVIAREIDHSVSFSFGAELYDTFTSVRYEGFHNSPCDDEMPPKQR